MDLETLKRDLIKDLCDESSPQVNVMKDVQRIVIENSEYQWMIGEYAVYPKQFIASIAILNGLVKTHLQECHVLAAQMICSTRYIHLSHDANDTHKILWQIISKDCETKIWAFTTSSSLSDFNRNNHVGIKLVLILKNGCHIRPDTVFEDFHNIQQQIQQKQMYRLLHRLSNFSDHRMKHRYLTTRTSGVEPKYMHLPEDIIQNKMLHFLTTTDKNVLSMVNKRSKDIINNYYEQQIR